MKNIKRGLDAREKALDALKEKKSGVLKEGIVWADTAVLQEMITTADGGTAFVEKVTYEAYDGRESVALLYNDIYSVTVDRSLPELLTIKTMGPGQVVFLEHLEGEEVKFGTLKGGSEVIVRIKTYSAGLQVTEDMVEYNQLYAVADMARDMGEAFNKLLNHIHLYPIISGTYVTTAGGLKAQKKTQKAGTAQLVAWSTDLKTTLSNALAVLPFSDFKVLVASVDMIPTMDAINAMVNTDGSASEVKRVFTADKFIAYDGEEFEVGAKSYSYDGVPEGFMFIVSTAKRNFRNYTKHDLIIDADNADLSRLIEEQNVGRARMGVVAKLGGTFGAVKVDIKA